MGSSALSSGSHILGLDPGLQVTGYAVLEARNGSPRVCEAGVIRSAEGRETADMAQRLRFLYNGIVEVLEQFQPGVVVVEQLFAHYEHPRTAIQMAHARGVLFLAAGPRVRQSLSARQQNLERLRQVRQQTEAHLLASLAWVRELASRIHLARFTDAPAARAEELLTEIAAGVETFTAPPVVSESVQFIKKAE